MFEYHGWINILKSSSQIEEDHIDIIVSEDGKDNEYQVILSARGKVKGYSDPFLSPIIPRIEDAIE